MSTQPNAASAGRMDRPGTAPAYRSPVEAFIRGNYFYVLSAVAFLAGCYLLINAPFIAGTTFVRTLKSFLVLQGYEVLLLGTAGFITWKIGRGGDVTTLFLIAFVLMLDPTFFGNAFYTIRQGVSPVWPLTVCGLSLIAVFAKFEIFRRLLQLQVSWRFMAGFAIAACVVWLAGLVFRGDLSAESIIWYSYALAWTTFLVTAVIGEPGRACRLSGEQTVDGPRFSRFMALVPPLLCAIHQIELTRVFDITFAIWFLSPLFIAAGFAAVRSAMPQLKEGEWYLAANLVFAAAIYVSLPVGDVRPVFVGTSIPVPLVNTVAAIISVLGYGYWKHRSRIALYHLAIYVVALVLGAGLFLTIKYLIPALKSWEMPAFLADLLSFRGLVLLLAVLFGVLALRLMRAIYWFLAASCTIMFLFGLLPGGYGDWTMEMLQAMLAALFVYYLAIGASTESLRKTATLLIALGLGRAVLFPNSVTLSVLFIEAVALIALSFKLKDFYYGIWGGLGLLIAGGNVAEDLFNKVHPSIIALSLGLILFALGIYVTFKKSTLPLPMVQGANAGGGIATVGQVTLPPATDSPDGSHRAKNDAAVEAKQQADDAPEAGLQEDNTQGADSMGAEHTQINTEEPGTLAAYIIDQFSDDPNLRIRRFRSLTDREKEHLRKLTAIDALDPLIVVFGLSGSDSALVVSSVQLALVNSTYGATTRLVPFNTLAQIGLNYFTIALRTNTGQSYLFTCDSPPQAEKVVQGLENVLVEAILRQHD